MLHGFNILRQQYSNLAKPGGGNQSAINTIQTLADRLIKADEYQLSLEDRRAAVLALKGLSRDHNRAVGQHALPALLKSLQRDAKDEDTARALIECSITLCEVQLPEAAATAQASGQTQAQAQNRRKQQNQGPPSGLQHTDVFLQEPGPLHCLLPLLAPHRAFYTRFASLQLLGSLLRNRPHRVQDHVLVAPGGCGAILECLAEGAGSSAEIVRNEALLLLPHLVYANADIQKLVAFEGAFEKLLDVCAAQGRIEGGIIVQDALEGLEALLRYNVSNQNYFRETLSIPMLAPLLFYPPGSPNNGLPFKHADHEYARQLEAFCFQDWDQQKVVNAKIVLDIAALLIAGQAEGRRANQAALLQCGMTKCLIDLALGSTAPVSLKAQALHLLASLMQSSRANQDLLSSLLVQPVKVLLPPKTETPIEGQHGGEQQQQLGKDPTFASQEPSFTRLQPRPAAVCLVETAIGTSGAKGGLGLRGAAIACFRSYVADNMEARLSIVNGMLPEAAAEEDNATASAASPAGKILFEGITQNPSTTATSDHADAYIHLISTMLFSYLLRGSETAKSAARSIAIDPDGKVVKHVRAEKQGDNDDDDDDDDDAPSSLIQVLVANLTLSERELADAVRKERASALGSTVSSHSYSAADWTRIMVGYLVLLSIWLHESPLSVRDFLSESATLQAVIQPVAQSSGVDPLIQGLAAFLLGVAYEFDTDPGKVAVTRATMHPILHSRIGADQFAVRIARISDDVRFRQVTPDILKKLIFVEEQTEADELRAKQQAEAKAAAAAAATAASASPSSPSSASPSHPSTGDGAKSEEKVKTDEEAADKDLEVNGLGHLSKRRRAGLWFDWSFVEFWRLNSTLISRSITVDPASSSAREAAMPVELLDAQRQAEALRDTVAKQTREIEMLEKRRDQLSCTNTKQLEQLQIQLTKAQEELASSTPQLEALREEIEELKSAHAASLAAEQSRNHDLVQLLEEARKSEEECRGKVLQLTSEIARSSAGKPTQKELLALQKTNDELKRKYDQLLTSTSSSSSTTTSSAASGGVGLKELLEARDLAESRARQISDLEAKLAGNLAETAASQSTEEKRELQRRVHELEAQASAAKAEGDRVSADQSTQLSAAKREKEVLETKLSELEKKLEECMFSKNPSRSHSSLTEGQQGRELEQANKEKEEISRENEDLLVLLEELTQKRKSDKARLRTKGELVSDDDDDEQTAD